MANEVENKDVVFDIDVVIKKIEEATDVKFKSKGEFDIEYISLGQVTEKDLTDLGFEFTGYSSGVKCPMYRIGKNIEAIFDESILHIYDLRG